MNKITICWKNHNPREERSSDANKVNDLLRMY